MAAVAGAAAVVGVAAVVAGVAVAGVVVVVVVVVAVVEVEVGAAVAVAGGVVVFAGVVVAGVAVAGVAAAPPGFPKPACCRATIHSFLQTMKQVNHVMVTDNYTSVVDFSLTANDIRITGQQKVNHVCVDYSLTRIQYFL